MSDDEEIHRNKRTDKTYISRSIADEKKIRIASKVFDSADGAGLAFAIEKKAVVLRRTPSGRKEIVAKFMEDDRRAHVLTFQSFNPEKGTPHHTYFSFVGSEIPKVLELFDHIAHLDFENSEKINITDEELRGRVLSKTQAAKLVRENPEIFAEVMKAAITKDDVAAIGHRKKQLTTFDQLLTDRTYFDQIKAVKQCKGDEDLWQRFFEKNEWIFGYGLNYFYVSALDEKRLMQSVQGSDLIREGKTADAVMKTRGILSALCFVEIKKHGTELLKKTPYRSGCWAASDELAGAIAQVQGTVASAMRTLYGALRPKDKHGDPTGEEIFNYKPRAFIVIGTLQEFVSGGGVNEEKMRSFELLRGSIQGIEILTFDELYQRCRFIVEGRVEETATAP